MNTDIPDLVTHLDPRSCGMTIQLGEQAAREINDLHRRRVAELEDWKAQAMRVESEWDEQKLAKMLGANLGESCRKIIQKRVPELFARIAELEQQLATALIPRPIAEAGPVKEGFVRLHGDLKPDCGWTQQCWKSDTHFLDIHLPSPDPRAEYDRAVAEAGGHYEAWLQAKGGCAMTITQFCEKHQACVEGREWAISNCKDMNEVWQTAKPEWLIWVATRKGVLADKELRLFAVWSARQVQHLMTDPRSIEALDVAERYANGNATREELDAACSTAWSVVQAVVHAAAQAAAQTATWSAAQAAARAAAWDAQAQYLRNHTQPNFDQ